MVALKVIFVIVILIFQVVTEEYVTEEYKDDEDYDDDHDDYDDDHDDDYEVYPKDEYDDYDDHLDDDYDDFDPPAKSNQRRNLEGSCNRCGISFGGPNGGRVINGKPVRPLYKYPWIVGTVKRGILTCGGALISANFVLTAAHCVFNKEKLLWPQCKGRKVAKNCYIHPNSMRVALAFREQRSETIAVSKIIVHPKYSYTMQIHDIALIQLAKPVRCSSYVMPICLPNRDVQRLGQLFTTAGYGHSTPEGTIGRKILREGQMREVDPRRCLKPNQGYAILRTVACAAGLDTRQSSCFGDSGSSLFAKYGSKYYAVGVVSHGTGSGCDTRMPVTYMKPSAYLPFIHQYVQNIPGN